MEAVGTFSSALELYLAWLHNKQHTLLTTFPVPAYVIVQSRAFVESLLPYS